MNPVYDRWLADKGISELDTEILRKYSNEEIAYHFGSPLNFGTGGLRSVVGLGANKMNIYTVAQISQGLAGILIREKKEKIVIAYDGRQDSQAFAREVAQVMLGNGLTVYLYTGLRPTPTLSFAVGHLKADCGVMITASHNPKEYNGYKIYGQNGAQVKGSIETAIVEAVKAVDNFADISKMTLEGGEIAGRLIFIGGEVDIAYTEAILETMQRPIMSAKTDLKVVYTPLHGTGAVIVPGLLDNMGFSNFLVTEQMIIDPNFTTVPYPNPEDIAVFALAINLAIKEDADIILATDPDCDRLGVMVKEKGEYRKLTGNEVGLLLLYHIITTQQAKGILPSNGLVISSVVSSPLAKIIANGYNLFYEGVLIGFKYAGEAIYESEIKGEKEFLFAYEESCGYLTGHYTKDKDGAQASLLICEMAAFYKEKGQTLFDVLENIYETFGYSMDKLHTFSLPGAAGQKQITQIMDFLFANPPKTILGKEVIETDNFRVGISISPAGERKIPQSNFLKLHTPNATVAFRPSQTEPKLKVYVNCWGEDKDEVLHRRGDIIKEMIDLVEGIIQ